METRKVQLTGKSTFVVSLPKKWVTKVNVRTGDSVAMLPLPDGTLLINPMIARKERDSKKRVISLDVKDEEQVLREFIGAYLAGYNLFEFRSRSTIDKETRQMVRAVAETVIGPQIIDEAPNYVLMRNLLDASDFTMGKSVKRMHIIAREMLLEALGMVQKRSSDGADEVARRDDDVDRLARMITKQYNLILRDVGFADKMGMRPQEALGHLLLSRTLERIADHAVRLAKNAGNSTRSPEVARMVSDTGQAAVALLDDAMSAFYRGRMEQAFEVAQRGREMERVTSKLMHDVLTMSDEAPASVPLALIVDSLERTRAYTVDIAETAINHIFGVEYDAEVIRQTTEDEEKRRSTKPSAAIAIVSRNDPAQAEPAITLNERPSSLP